MTLIRKSSENSQAKCFSLVANFLGVRDKDTERAKAAPSIWVEGRGMTTEDHPFPRQ